MCSHTFLLLRSMPLDKFGTSEGTSKLISTFWSSEGKSKLATTPSVHRNRLRHSNTFLMIRQSWW